MKIVFGMDMYIPNEADIKRWIKEAIKECLDPIASSGDEKEEQLLTRKQIANIFSISLVTLHAWIKKGLPVYKNEGRVYFLRSEVMEYFRKNRKRA